MIIKVRHGCFETNSSIEHALIVLLEEDDEKWKNDDHLYIYTSENPEYNSVFKKLSAEERPVYMRLYTEEEVFAFIEKGSGRTKEEILDDIDEEYDDMADMLYIEYDFITSEMWFSGEYYYDTYKYTAPSGERFKIHARYRDD